MNMPSMEVLIDMKKQLVHPIKPLYTFPYFCITLSLADSYLYLMINLCRITLINFIESH